MVMNQMETLRVVFRRAVSSRVSRVGAPGDLLRSMLQSLTVDDILDGLHPVPLPSATLCGAVAGSHGSESLAFRCCSALTSRLP